MLPLLSPVTKDTGWVWKLLDAVDPLIVNICRLHFFIINLWLWEYLQWNKIRGN